MPRGELTYRRGEIWWVELDPVVGVETKKTRACLILQNDFGNKQSSLTTVAPFLERKNYPFVVNFPATPENGLDKPRGLHLNQIRAIDAQRIKSKLGTIEEYYWAEIKNAIAIQFGF
jgi:mRNA interferase MazF